MLAAADEMNEWETSTRHHDRQPVIPPLGPVERRKCGRLIPQPTANLRDSPWSAQPTAILLCQIEIDSNHRSAVNGTQVLRLRIQSVQ